MRTATHPGPVHCVVSREAGARGGAPVLAGLGSVGRARYSRVVPDQMVELLLTEAAHEKLGTFGEGRPVPDSAIRDPASVWRDRTGNHPFVD